MARNSPGDRAGSRPAAVPRSALAGLLEQANLVLLRRPAATRRRANPAQAPSCPHVTRPAATHGPARIPAAAQLAPRLEVEPSCTCRSVSGRITNAASAARSCIPRGGNVCGGSPERVVAVGAPPSSSRQPTTGPGVFDRENPARPDRCRSRCATSLAVKVAITDWSPPWGGKKKKRAARHCTRSASSATRARTDSRRAQTGPFLRPLRHVPLRSAAPRPRSARRSRRQEPSSRLGPERSPISVDPTTSANAPLHDRPGFFLLRLPSTPTRLYGTICVRKMFYRSEMNTSGLPFSNCSPFWARAHANWSKGFGLGMTR